MCNRMGFSIFRDAQRTLLMLSSFIPSCFERWIQHHPASVVSFFFSLYIQAANVIATVCLQERFGVSAQDVVCFTIRTNHPKSKCFLNMCKQHLKKKKKITWQYDPIRLVMDSSADTLSCSYNNGANTPKAPRCTKPLILTRSSWLCYPTTCLFGGYRYLLGLWNKQQTAESLDRREGRSLFVFALPLPTWHLGFKRSILKLKRAPKYVSGNVWCETQAPSVGGTGTLAATSSIYFWFAWQFFL